MAWLLEVGLRQKLVLAREMDLMPARRLSRVTGSAPRRAREEFQIRPLGVEMGLAKSSRSRGLTGRRGRLSPILMGVGPPH